MNRRDLLRTAAAAAAAAVAATLPLPALADDLEMASVTRTVQVYRDGQWTVTPWEGLKRGMLFRLWEGDGTLVDVDTPNEVSVALEDACIVQTGPGQKNWSIRCEPFTHVSKDDPPRSFKVRVLGREGVQVGLVEELDMSSPIGLPRAWQALRGVRDVVGMDVRRALVPHNIEVVFAEQVFRDLTVPA